jgi:CTD kinase subunit beta
VRIPLNQEAEAQNIPRHTNWVERGKEPRMNGVKGGGGGGGGRRDPAVHPLTPVTANGDRPKPGERGRDGAVRFMLDPECAEAEKAQVEGYFRVEMEEFEVE